jgi:SH3-like domain-containing protein
MLVMRWFLTFITLALPAWASEGTNSGLPIPRFVALKSDETNIRTGPGTRYPIQWIYRRAGMPVEVVEEFDLWRKVRDMDGTSGWVHKTMVVGKRTVMIKGSETRVVRIDADARAKPILKLEPSVIASVLECMPDWCRIQISGRKGWIEKQYLWGAYKDEVFD